MARTQFSTAIDRRDESDGPKSRRLDVATVVGLLSAFGLVAFAMTVGGSPKSFIDIPALLIVLGGTFGVTTVSFSLEEVLRCQSVISKAVVRTVPDPAQTATSLVEMAIVARRQGPLAIENAVNTEVTNAFGRRALQMVIDGEPGDEIERVLQRDIDEMTVRHINGAAILRRAAETAPAMGLIGTLIGLVQMLGNLNDVSTIGPSMAIALLTTFYGAVLSSMLFSPLANKLERNSEKEALNAQLYKLTAASMGRQENPRRLEMLLNALLPPSKRISTFA